MNHAYALLTSFALLMSFGCGSRAETPEPASAASTGDEQAPAGVTASRADAPPIAPVAADEAPAMGDADGAIVIEVYADFECPHCARSHEATDRVREQYPSIALVYRFYPLSMHQNARPAANAALEVFRQAGDEAFWDYSEQVYAHQDNLTRRVLTRLARELGYDADQVEQAILEGRHDPRIDADMARGLELGIRGTPTFVVNGEVVDSPSYDDLLFVVEEQLDAP